MCSKTLQSTSLLPSAPVSAGTPRTKGGGLWAPVLETALDLCWEHRKFCRWLRQKARLVLGSSGAHATLLPNFREVSGSFCLPRALASLRFAVSVPCKAPTSPWLMRGARNGGSKGHQHLERDTPRVGEHASSPGGYICQSLFRKFYFSKYTVYLQL